PCQTKDASAVGAGASGRNSSGSTAATESWRAPPATSAVMSPMVTRATAVTPGTARTACACSGVNPEVETAWRAGVTGVTDGSGESVALAAGAGPSAVAVTPGEELGGRAVP